MTDAIRVVGAVHTPGPWEVHRSGVIKESNFGGRHAGVFGARITDTEGHSFIPKVAKVVGMEDAATILANAHLIAAAPEMLGALVEVRARMQGYRLDLDASHALDRVDAAIAKARNQTAPNSTNSENVPSDTEIAS